MGLNTKSITNSWPLGILSWNCLRQSAYGFFLNKLSFNTWNQDDLTERECLNFASNIPPRLYPNKATNVWSFSWQHHFVLITPLPAILQGVCCWKTAPYLIPWCFWCGWSSDCTAPTTTCYPPWESRTQAALVRSYRLSYWLTKPRVSRKNKHEQRLQCMGQSAGSFSIWPWWSYSHGRLSFPCAIIYHNFEGQREKQTYNFSIGYIH